MNSGATKISTGVPGLDHVLTGGFLREGFYLSRATPVGQDHVALQYLLGRIKAGERCLYITLTESRARTWKNACRSHGWSLDGLEICDLTDRRPTSSARPKRPSSTRPRPSWGDHQGDPRRGRAGRSRQHVVFDGLSELRLLSGDPLRYRRQLLALKQFFAQRQTTVLLLDDRSSPFGDIQPESLVGGNIVLERFLPDVRQGPAAAVRRPRSAGRTSARGTTTTRSSTAGSSSTPAWWPPSTTSASIALR